MVEKQGEMEQGASSACNAVEYGGNNEHMRLGQVSLGYVIE